MEINMKFIASYSGGKESALSLYKAIREGHEPIALITTVNTDEGRSYSHGLSEDVLGAVSKSLGIPLWMVKTSGKEYADNFEEALLKGREQGAEACVFGDIDIEGHLEWCSQRCENVGIKPSFPLWGRPRKDVVFEMIDSGFVANISTINTKFLSKDFLGKRLTKEVAKQIADTGADICGENGEYHTFVSDGPIFKHPIAFSFGDVATNGDYAMLPVHLVCKDNYKTCLHTCGGTDVACDFALLVDEVASMTGLLHSIVSHEGLKEELRFVCDIIYNLSPSFRTGMVLNEEDFAKLERLTLTHKDDLGDKAKIVLPMGCQGASLAHILRVKCKALVRQLCKQNRANGLLYDFTNLLSGYFYYLAFKLNKIAGIEEIPFVSRKR